MRPTSFSVTPFALAILALAACGEDKGTAYDPAKTATVETTVDPASLRAGAHATVQCARLNGHGEAIAGGDFTVVTTPATGLAVTGLDIEGQLAGAYTVACVESGTAVTDLTPASLTVTQGDAVATELTLTPASVAAGEPAATTCRAVDAYGNTVPGGSSLRIDVTPDTSVTVSGLASVSARTVGTYTVTCFVSGVGSDHHGHAELTVTPGPQANMVLSLAPEAVAYKLGQYVTVSGVGTDQYGNVVPGTIPLANITITPDGHHELFANAVDKFRFSLEGKYVVSAEAASDANVKAQVPLVVDQTPPVLVVDEPARGIVTDTLTTIHFAGHVTDNLGEIASLMIGTNTVAVGPDGAFAADIPLVYGIDLFDIVATDPYGLETFATRSVEKSDAYFPMVQPTFVSDGVGNALALVLTQDAIDDHDHHEATRDDLASIIEFVVENIDLTTLVPNPLTTFSCIGGDCTMVLTSVTMSDVNVAMTLMDGKIHLEITIDGLAGTLTLFFPCAVPGLCTSNPQPLPGTFGASHVVLATDIEMTVLNGQIDVATSNTDVTISDVTIDIHDPTGLAQAAITFALSYLQSGLTTGLEVLIETLVQTQLASAFDSLFGALTFNRELTLPSLVPNQPGNTIVLATQAKGVDIAPERLQLRVDALAYAKTPVRPHPHLGSIKHSGCAPMSSLVWPPPSTIQVGLHDDFINELLFAIWDGGTVNLSLGPEQAATLVGNFGLQNATITVDALLPPVLNSCGNKGLAPDNVVQIGDLYVDVVADFAGQPTHLTLWLLAAAPIDVKFATDAAGATTAAIALGEIDPLWIEVVRNEGALEDDDGAVVDLVKNVLIPQLLSTVETSATFTLPSIDLSSLTSAVPAGTVINIDVQSVGRDNAYLTLNGGLK